MIMSIKEDTNMSPCHAQQQIAMQNHVRMKAVSDGREMSLTTFIFTFLFGNGKEIGNARLEKQNWIYKMSETK